RLNRRNTNHGNEHESEEQMSCTHVMLLAPRPYYGASAMDFRVQGLFHPYKRRAEVGLRSSPGSAALALCRLVYRGRAAAKGRTDEGALLPTDESANARAAGRRPADDHRGLLPRPARRPFTHDDSLRRGCDRAIRRLLRYRRSTHDDRRSLRCAGEAPVEAIAHRLRVRHADKLAVHGLNER